MDGIKNKIIMYNVDEKNRVVIAHVNGCAFDALVKANSIMKNTYKGLMLGGPWNRDKYKMPETMKAIAKCMDCDVFDAEKGKIIARKKLVEKYNASLNKRLKKISKDLFKASMEIMNKVSL